MTNASQEWNVKFAVSFLNIVWTFIFSSNVPIQAADAGLCTILVGHHFPSHDHNLTSECCMYAQVQFLTVYLGQKAHII